MEADGGKNQHKHEVEGQLLMDGVIRSCIGSNFMCTQLYSRIDGQVLEICYLLWSLCRALRLESHRIT